MSCPALVHEEMGSLAEKARDSVCFSDFAGMIESVCEGVQCWDLVLLFQDFSH